MFPSWYNTSKLRLITLNKMDICFANNWTYCQYLFDLITSMWLFSNKQKNIDSENKLFKLYKAVPWPVCPKKQFLVVSEDDRHVHRGITFAKEVWGKLTTVFEDKGAARKLTTLNDLMDFESLWFKSKIERAQLKKKFSQFCHFYIDTGTTWDQIFSCCRSSSATASKRRLFCFLTTVAASVYYKNFS